MWIKLFKHLWLCCINLYTQTLLIRHCILSSYYTYINHNLLTFELKAKHNFTEIISIGHIIHVTLYNVHLEFHYQYLNWYSKLKEIALELEEVLIAYIKLWCVCSVCMEDHGNECNIKNLNGLAWILYFHVLAGFLPFHTL